MRNLIRLCDLIFILSSLAALVNLPFGFFFYLDENEAYMLGSWYWAANILPVVTLSCSALLILISRSLRQREKIIFLSFAFFPLLGVYLDYFFPDLVLTYVCLFLSGLAIYLEIFIRQGEKVAKQEAELAQNRIAIMLSQIQPHFLYNALATEVHPESYFLISSLLELLSATM
jgi:two-component system LytT family sensor kinase